MKLKNILHTGWIAAGLIISLNTYSQCYVSAISSADTVCAGDSVNLIAKGKCGVILSDKINNYGFNPGIWYSTAANPVFTSPCGAGPDKYHLWVGMMPSVTRTLVTQNCDVTYNKCFIEWWMRYGKAQNTGSCQAPDASNEGIHLQWSDNNGGSWTDFPGPNQEPTGNLSSTPPFSTTTAGKGSYWAPYSSPNDQQNSELYYWNQYRDTLPTAALTPNTRFRFAQFHEDGQYHDSWGIDKVEILCDTGPRNIQWSHGPTLAAPPAVYLPAKGNMPYDTCFSVTISDSLNSATDTICVTVRPNPGSEFTISDTSICKDDSTTITYTGNAGISSFYHWQINGDSLTGKGPHQISFQTSGVKHITLQVSDSLCSSPMTIKNIHVHPYPFAQIHQQWIETDERIFSDISGAGATNYQITNRQWNFGSAATPQSSVDSSVSVTYTSPGTHQAELVVTNNGGCPDTTQSYVVITGMVDNKYKNGIKLFPIPAQKYVNIHIPGFIEELPELRLYNMQGKLIRKEAIQNRTTKLYLHQLSPGNYMLVLENNSFVLNKKIRVK